jgi:hypothetical protein
VPVDLSQEFEARFVRPRPGRTLIVGSRVYPKRSDRRRLYRDAVGVDQVAGEGVDRALDLELELPADLGTFQHVECVSVLEHSPRPWLIAANIERLMEPGATLHLSVPFAWSVHAYPADYFRFTVEGVRTLFPGIHWAELLYAHGRFQQDGKVPPALLRGGEKYFARTQVMGFGERCASL